MNNLKRKYSSACPRMNLATHRNDRWRLVMRLQRTRRLYYVLVDEEDIGYHFFFKYAFRVDGVFWESSPPHLIDGPSYNLYYVDAEKHVRLPESAILCKFKGERLILNE